MSAPRSAESDVPTRAFADAPSYLERLASLAEQASAEPIAREAHSLADRLRDSAFYLACVGQFKRGKSTLLDALLGEQVLPVGVVPITSIPTVVRYGQERRARVSVANGTWRWIGIDEVESYVSEIENPENIKGVHAVEVFLPNERLRNGVCLVDTPGIGSVFELNTAATKAFVPHIDAALVVLGADPPISGDELELVTEMSAQISDLLFVLNKVDRLSAEETREAREFTSDQLARRLNKQARFFEVSAREQLANGSCSHDWPSLMHALDTLVESSRERLVNAAAERGVSRLTASLLERVSDERDALTQPIERLLNREKLLDELVSESERALSDLSTLMGKQQREAVVRTDERRKLWLRSIETEAVAELRLNTVNQRPHWGPEFRRWLLGKAQELAAGYIHTWLAGEETVVDAEYESIRTRFVRMSNDLLNRMTESGVRGLTDVTAAPGAEAEFDSRSRFHFQELISQARPASPFRYVADAALVAVGAAESIRRDADDFLRLLLEVNSSRVQRDLDDRLSATRGALEKAIREKLAEAIYSTRSALERIVATRQAGLEAVAAELQRIDSVEASLRRMARSHNVELNDQPKESGSAFVTLQEPVTFNVQSSGPSSSGA